MWSLCRYCCFQLSQEIKASHSTALDATRDALPSTQGLQDAFDPERHGHDRFSWWDYRQAAFRRNLGLRIDHILLSAPLHVRLRDWKVDKVPRKWERPSDHAPVVVELGPAD